MHSANNNKTQKLDSAYNSLCVLVEAYTGRKRKTSKRSSAQEYLHISSLCTRSPFSQIFFVNSRKKKSFFLENINERMCGLCGDIQYASNFQFVALFMHGH